MLPFGHLGVGSRIVRPFARGLRLRWILLGTLLPDLIDKPLYYGMVFATGLRGQELGLISGTRTFGHTGLLILVIAIVASWKRSRLLAAVCLGMLSHLFLDRMGDAFSTLQISQTQVDAPGTMHAILFPFLGWHFPVNPYTDAVDHAASVFLAPYHLIGELLGLAILFWEYWKWRHRSEIIEKTRKFSAID